MDQMDWGGESRGRESTVHLWHVAGICGYHRAGDLGILHDFIRWHMDVVLKWLYGDLMAPPF